MRHQCCAHMVEGKTEMQGVHCDVMETPMDRDSIVGQLRRLRMRAPCTQLHTIRSGRDQLLTLPVPHSVASCYCVFRRCALVWSRCIKWRCCPSSPSCSTSCLGLSCRSLMIDQQQLMRPQAQMQAPSELPMSTRCQGRGQGLLGFVWW